MTIKFNCAHCQKPLQVKDDLAGKKVKCPGCQAILDVPTAVSVPAGAPAVPPRPAPPKPPAPAAAPKPPPAAAKPNGTAPVPTVKPAAPRPPAVKPPNADTPLPTSVPTPPPIQSPVAKAPGTDGARPPAKAPTASVPPVAPKPQAKPPSKPGEVKKPIVPAKPPARIVKKKPPGTDGAAALPPGDLDDLAASLFSDEPPPEEEKVDESAPITFKCYYCDQNVTVPADLGGKQAPCPNPECRRIVKIPLPEKPVAKDWRKIDTRRPAGARQDLEPAPEGTWDATDVLRVSTDALYEADAIPIKKAPLTTRQWVNRVAFGIVAAGVLLTTTLMVWDYLFYSKQERALKQALDATKKENFLRPEEAAVIHRAAGEFYARAGDPEQAREQFEAAQGLIKQMRRGTLESDAQLIELTLASMAIAGSYQDYVARTHLKWDDAQKVYQHALLQVAGPEARLEAVRQVTRRLMELSKQYPTDDLPGRAVTAARFMRTQGEEERWLVPEMLAACGLELLDADKVRAEALASQAFELYQQKPTEEKKPTPLPVAPSLIGLLYALDEGDKRAGTLLPLASVASAPEARVGYTIGYALTNKGDEAFKIANNTQGEPAHRFEALVALASVSFKDKARAQEAVNAAVALYPSIDPKRTPVSPWAVLRLVTVAGRLGMADQMKPFVAALPAGPLQNRASLEVYRALLGPDAAADPAALTKEAAAGALAHPRTLEFLARHNAARGSSSAVQKETSTWTPETLRPLGPIGVALGLQDSDLGAPASR